jgi:hypothetical protein
MEVFKISNRNTWFLRISGILSSIHSKLLQDCQTDEQLLEMDAKLKWSPQCEQTFLTLKKLLTTAPILAQPDIEKPFDVYCDASSMGIGGVLMQNGRAIAYASQQLRRHEEHYPTHSLEILVVLHALKVWRHHLLGNLVHIYTNHKSQISVDSIRLEYEATNMARADQEL